MAYNVRTRPQQRAGSRAPGLFGRSDQMATATAQVDAARDGEVRVVLVTGTAGLGKTRLVDEVLGQYADTATCLSARCYRWGTTSSLGPWLEALDRHLRALQPDEIRNLCGASLPDLAILLSSVAAVADETPPITDTTVHHPRMFEALVGLFDRLSSRGPVVVGLDDMHLADSSTWEAVRHLGRRLTGSPIALLLSARPGDLSRHPLATEVLLGLEEDGLLCRVPLAPLTRTSITELAHDVLRADGRSPSSFVPEPLVAWLAQRSLGHPLFVLGLLEALLAEGGELSHPTLERLPASLRDRVALEFATLEPDAREALEILAIADQPLGLGELERITDGSLDAPGASLDVLVDTRLVTERRRGADVTYEIAHPLVQEAVYESIGTSRRRQVHRAVGRAMHAAGSLGAAASHLARAADPGDDEAIDALIRAIEQAERRGLYRESLAILSALLDVLPAEDPRWRDVVEVMDWQAEWVLSHLAENDATTATAAMERISLHLGDGDDVARATVALYRAGFLSFGEGRLDQAMEACQQAITGFQRARDATGTLLARNERAWIDGCAGRLADQHRHASAVLADAEAHQHVQAATQAAGTAAYAAGYLGRFDDAEDLYARALTHATATGNRYRVAWTHAQRGCMRSVSGRLQDGLADINIALEVDHRAPDAIVYEDLAHALWLAGRLEEALDALQRSWARRPIRGSRRRAWGAALAARVHLERGQLPLARSHLHVTDATYGNHHFLMWGFWHQWSTALLAWHDDGPSVSLSSLVALASELASQCAVPYEALVQSDIADVAVDASEAGVAAQAASRTAQLADMGGGALLAGLGALTQARAQFLAGHHRVASQDALHAAQHFGSAGHGLLRGQALDMHGRAQAQEDREVAVDALERAAEVFKECGASWRRERALAELARLGSRGRRAAAAIRGPAALTPRERDVAILAAEGHTAREIGERLFIGRRTVESHLANCYAKLGVSSKRELLGRAGEFRSSPDPDLH